MEQHTEQNQETSLFGFGIDQSSRAHLSEAAKWAKFLSIIGFVMSGLLAVVGLFAGSLIGLMTRRYSDGYGGASEITGGLAIFMSVMYVGIAVLVFLPYLFLYRFATRMRTALSTNDQQTLNSSFQNLKIMFRYVGIMTIIGLSFYALMIFVFIISAATVGS
ncbi:MAG TPA: DUF5362 family protein [Chitinophagaceae bacterium]|nr:DUF5362 family protein [Chitinophagaceae bacterium]